MEPYAPRSFRFVELLGVGPSRTGIIWRMKLYGIAAERELPRPELLAAAKKVAAETLAKETANNYKVGFIGAHDGKNASFVFVDFWGNENELFHRVFLCRSNDLERLTAATPADSSVCVWDLHLQSFERAAWIKHVLRKAEAPDFEGYLAERLNDDL
jgi:hypothetical protein